MLKNQNIKNKIIKNSYSSFYTADQKKISQFCFGGWGIGSKHTAMMNKQKAKYLIETAIEHDVRLIDTSPVYGDGHSEQIIGEVIKNKRESVFIATKGGMSWKNENIMICNSTKKQLEIELHQSLQRLQTDYIDLYQIHWPDYKTPFEETISVLHEFKRDGKIRFIGLSNFKLEDLYEILKLTSIDAFQGQYNLLSRECETDFMGLFREHKINFLTYGSLAYGLLSGKFKEKFVFDKADWRRKGISLTNTYFLKDNFKKNIDRVENLKKLAKKTSFSCSQLAIAWLLQKKQIYALIGLKSISQFRENIISKEIVLDKEIIGELEKI